MERYFCLEGGCLRTGYEATATFKRCMTWWLLYGWFPFGGLISRHWYRFYGKLGHRLYLGRYEGACDVSLFGIEALVDDH